jgi:hypothetical protein
LERQKLESRSLTAFGMTSVGWAGDRKKREGKDGLKSASTKVWNQGRKD